MQDFLSPNTWLDHIIEHYKTVFSYKTFYMERFSISWVSWIACIGASVLKGCSLETQWPQSRSQIHHFLAVWLQASCPLTCIFTWNGDPNRWLTRLLGELMCPKPPRNHRKHTSSFLSHWFASFLSLLLLLKIYFIFFLWKWEFN